MTTVLTVESGVTPTFPVSTFSTLSEAVAFGEGVRSLGAVSGSPVSYVPPRETETAGASGSGEGAESGDEEEGDDDNDNKLIIGLSVGLGVPVLIGVAAGVWYVYLRPPHHFSKHILLTGYRLLGGLSIVGRSIPRSRSLSCSRSPRRRRTRRGRGVQRKRARQLRLQLPK
jgi:hypothetical protein